MSLLTIFLLLILNLSVNNASCAENVNNDITVLPHFYNIGSTFDTSTMNMQCYGDEPYSLINCTFSQINIRKPVNGTCAISEYLLFRTMHQVSKNRWDSEMIGNGGMITIEYESSSSSLWKYREITNDTPSKVLTYSWDAPTEYSIESLGCKKIKFIGTNKDTIGIK